MNRTVSGNLLKLEGLNGVLEIRTDIKANTAVMKLRGSLSKELETDFADEALALISAGKNLLLDFSELTYISKSAQKELLDIQGRYIDRTGAHMEIVGVPEDIYAQFRSSRLDTQLRIRRRE